MKTHIKATLRPASFLPQRFRQNAPGRSLPAQYESDWQNNRRCTYANRRQGDKRYSDKDEYETQKPGKDCTSEINTILK